MAAFTRQILIDVTNEILSPSWQLRNAAVHAFHDIAQFSPELIANLQWGDILAHLPPTELILETRDVRALRLPSEAVPAFSAWATYAEERGWCGYCNNLVFPNIRDHQYRLNETLDLRYVEARWEADDIAEPGNQDLRDVAALVLARVRGVRGENPAAIAQMRWGDLSEIDYRWGNEDHHQRISLFEVLGEWGAVWEEIVGRKMSGPDPILIPASTGRLTWETSVSPESARPKPLSVTAYYRIFRKRGSLAGYPWLTASDCTAKESDGNVATKTAF